MQPEKILAISRRKIRRAEAKIFSYGQELKKARISPMA
jgi:hypothetical protein